MRMHRFQRIRDFFRHLGAKSIISSTLVFLLTVAATGTAGYLLLRSTRMNIHLQGEVNAVEAAKDFDNYLMVRKNTVILAGHVIDEMIREGKPTSEIIEYLTAESLSIKKTIDKDYTGLYGWINGEYCDGVGWVPDEDYVATERPWYRETIADDGDVTFVKPYLDEQTGTVLTTIAVQLSDSENVVALDVPLTLVQAITEEIAQHTPGGYGVVLDKTGQVIAHSDKGELGKNYLEETDTLGAALAERLLHGSEQEFELNFGGQRYTVFSEKIEGDWQSISLLNTRVFYKPSVIILTVLLLFTALEAVIFVTVMKNQREKNLALASAEAARSASLAKSRFLSRMSHEIRTPINAIMGLNSIVLHDDSISPHTREELEKIGSSARHLLSIINDILDMSRIESGRMELKEELFSFHDFLEQIRIIAGGQCEDKRLRFDCIQNGPIDAFFVGDSLKLKQVIINILGNSVKFTDSPGSVTLSVTEETLSPESAVLRFTMRDTGIGMDKEFLPKLFEAFSQEDAANTSRFGGNGLGMAITKSFVEMMGGEIEVESEKGVGTCFTVTVPLKRASEAGLPAKAPEPADIAAEAVRLAGVHVLIAEDQEMNAEVLTDLLEMEDISSEWAENGQLAVEMFSGSEENHFDAVLMDMRMPVMDGLAAARELRRLDRQDAKRVPIIALTANAFEEDVQQCLQAGMNAHLSKPVDIDTLVLTLGRLLAEGKSQRPDTDGD